MSPQRHRWVWASGSKRSRPVQAVVQGEPSRHGGSLLSQRQGRSRGDESPDSEPAPPRAGIAGQLYSQTDPSTGEGLRQRLADEEATLRRRLEDEAKFLFTASHGMGWPREHQNQRTAQGALLCQDWSGFGSVRPGDYLSAADVNDDARFQGLVAFMFACYGAGTPAFDNYLSNRNQGPIPIADQGFIARLPQPLLSHPQGVRWR